MKPDLEYCLIAATMIGNAMIRLGLGMASLALGCAAWRLLGVAFK